MPVCSACNHNNPDKNKFCGQCGTRLPDSPPTEISARQKEVRNGLRAIMPTSLAQKIQAAMAEPVGRRREVTILLLEYGFDGTGSPPDSETAYLLSDEIVRLLAEVVYKYEATIDKYTGDGLVILFGLPVAHENDPERAARAALEMRTALEPLRKRVKQQHQANLEIRIGINTGQVISGQMGSDLQSQYTVIGNTINCASDLPATVAPHAIAVSFATYQRTRPLFNYRVFSHPGRKPDQLPRRAFELLALREKSGRVHGLPGLQVPMIGRQTKLSNLTSALDEVRQQNQTRIAVITGEAGVGKSRLMAEFRKAAQKEDTPIYQGNCLNYARSKSLWLIADLLRDICGISETDPPDRQQITLQTYLNQLELAVDEVFPYLANVLELEPADPKTEARLQHFDDATLQKFVHSAVRQVILAEARRSPAILILENLHWIDSASRDLLVHLIQTVSDLPLMLVLISRDTERETVLMPLLQAINQYHQQTQTDIQLIPLSAAEAQQLVAELLRQTSSGEGQAIRQQIVDRAAGNPFFAEEIVRMLIEQGGLVEQEGVWQPTPETETILAKVPGSLNGLILARFDRLPEPLQQCLQTAAVLGTSFPIGLLQRLSDPEAETLFEQIDALEKRRFFTTELVRTGETIRFIHALVQKTVYSTLLKRDCRRLHGQVAQVIETQSFWLPDAQTEMLAYHFSRSADPAQAIPHLLTAAENATRRYANEDAIRHYRQALELMGPDPALPYGEAFFRTRIGLGRALKFAGEFAESAQFLSDALQQVLRWSLSVDTGRLLSVLVGGLCELADIRQRDGAFDEAMGHLEAASAALGPDGERAHPNLWRSVLDRMAAVRFRQGNLESALELATTATMGVDPDKVDDPITLAALYNTLGGIFWRWGNLKEAEAHVSQSLAIYRSLGYSFGLANAYTNLGILYSNRGLWSKALSSFQESHVLRQEINYMPMLTINLKNMGWLQISMGNHKEARKNLQTGLDMSRRLNDNRGVVEARIELAHLDVIQCNFEAATIHLDEIALATDHADPELLIKADWLRALVKAERDDLSAGITFAEAALNKATAGGLTEVEADCRRVLGMLKAKEGDYLEAETLLQESVDLCIQANASYGRSLAQIELGQLYLDMAQADPKNQSERTAKSRAILNIAIEELTRLGANYDLKVARVLLKHAQVKSESGVQLPASPPAPSTVIDAPLAGAVSQGARHTATVVWFEIEPPAHLDEETVFETLARVVAGVAVIAEEHDGQIIRRRKGAMIVFGTPVAFEDDPERAVQTAWHITQQLKQLGGPPMIFKLGISQGEVVAGNVGSAFHTEFMVSGAPVQEAQAIAQAVPTAGVWVSEAVRATAARLFTFTPVPQQEIPATVSHPLWKLEGFLELPGEARGLPGIKAKLVGRGSLLQEMIQLSTLLKKNLGGLIWVEGEPGIGKSRLIQEFIAAANTPQTLLWVGKCSPQKSGQAFSVFTDLLAQAFSIKSSDNSDRIRDKIESTIAGWPKDTKMTRPYLEMLMAIQPGGQDGQRLANLEPEQLRQQTFVAVRRLFKSLANVNPLVLVFDDLHWVDHMSAELLQFLLTMVTSTPILFVCAQRRQGADSPNDRLTRLQSLIPTQTMRVRLQQLSRDQSLTLISELLPRTELPLDVQKTILERSEGNPYFIEEFVRMLIEQGYLTDQDGVWRVNPESQLSDLPLPSSLDTLISSRVDALPPELKLVVQAAAVIGEPFEAWLLQTVTGIESAATALRRLESRLMVHRSSKPGQWVFNHSLVETVVYNTLLKAQQKSLHLKVGRALENRGGDAETDQVEKLAYHFTRAEEGSKSLNYLILAGEWAAARSANEAATSYFEQAANLLSHHPDVPNALRWRLVAGMGDVYQAMGRYDDSTNALETGLILVEMEELSTDCHVGLYRRLGETARKNGKLDVAVDHYRTALDLINNSDDHQTRLESARILTGLAGVYFLQGKLDQAKVACEASLQHAQSIDALNELASAENRLGGIYYRQSNWTSALHHTMRAMILREQMGYSWGTASTLSNLGILAFSAGHWNKARAYFERSLSLRKELGDVEGMVIVYNNLGSIASEQGELTHAEDYFRQSLNLAMPFQMAWHIANSSVGLSRVLLLQNNVDASQETLAAGRKRAEAIGAKDLNTEISRLQAEILLQKSALPEAQKTIEQAIEQAIETGNRAHQSAAWRVAAEIARRNQQVAAAHKALENAKQILTGTTDELESGRVSARLGQLYIDQDEPEKARSALQTAREVFIRLGAELDIEQVDCLLKALFVTES